MTSSRKAGDPELIERTRAGWDAIGGELVSLLRYQAFGGGPADKDAALYWLNRRAPSATPERVYVAPGAHSALLTRRSMAARATRDIRRSLRASIGGPRESEAPGIYARASGFIGAQVD